MLITAALLVAYKAVIGLILIAHGDYGRKRLSYVK